MKEKEYMDEVKKKNELSERRVDKSHSIHSEGCEGKTMYECYKCNYKTKRKYDYNCHLKTKKHNLSTLRSDKLENSPKCNEGELRFDFDSVSGKSFDSSGLRYDNSSVDSPPFHSGEFSIASRSSNVRQFSKSSSQNMENGEHEKEYVCCCNKIYKGKNGRNMLNRHRNKCQMFEHRRAIGEREVNECSPSLPSGECEGKIDVYEEYIKNIQSQNDLLNKIIMKQEDKINETKQEIKDTLKVQSQILEYMKSNYTTTQTNTNIVNNDNKTININIFLNENCKDALNIEDFVNTLNMSIENIEEYANSGYVNWVTNVLMEGFMKTDVKKRPIHCSDLKREVLYIKNENKWEKDLEYKYFDKFLRKISNRYSLLFNEWCNINPLNYISGTNEYEKAVKMMCNTYSDEKKQKKILNTLKDKIYLRV